MRAHPKAHSNYYRCIFNQDFGANQRRPDSYQMVTAHLTVADAVDHLVIFTVEGVCQEAQALQQNRDGTNQFTAGGQPSRDDSAAQSESAPSGSTLVASSFSRSTRLSMSVES